MIYANTVVSQSTAADIARALIEEVPGTGSILGVWYFNDTVWAFRDQGASVSMFQSTSSGWFEKKTGLTSGGRYEFVNHNFGTAQKMYGVSGTHKAFEFDGNTTWTDITTGFGFDTPEHLAIDDNYLWLSFGSNIQNSPVGNPTGTWTLRTGSNRINTTEEVTGMKVQSGALIVFDRNKTWIHTGIPAGSDEQFVLHSDGSGAIEWTAQSVGNLVYMDDYGVTDLARVDAFGDFAQSTISQKIKTKLNAKKNKVTASVVIREKNEYVVFFNDDSALSFVFDKNKLVGICEWDLGVTVTCACSAEDSNGNEVVFVGSDNGFVYQMERGTSFDGEDIQSSAQLTFYHYGSPRVRKRFRRFSPEIEADTNLTIYIRPDFDYGDSNLAAPESESVLAGGGQWNVDNWDEFNWSTQSTSMPSIDVAGTGVNMGVVLFHKDAVTEPFVISAATTEYTLRRKRRR